MLEADLVTDIIKKLRKVGGWWIKVHGSRYQSRGLPDIIGCYLGRFYGFEVKVPGKEDTLTPTQALHLELIRNAGGVSGLVTSVEEAMALLRRRR
jgi:Holliday junction resolvase